MKKNSIYKEKKEKIPVKKSAKNLKEVQQNKRLLAEIDNLQKRHSQRLQELMKYGNQQLLEDLLEVLNNFELALRFPVQHTETKKFFLGIKMTHDKLEQILKTKGLNKIACEIGQTFDDHQHEIFDTDWNSAYKTDKVIKIIQTGYQLHDRILQPTKVVINRKKTKNKK